MPGSRPSRADVVGAVLAGGAGRRMGGGKAVAEFRGRPLIWWPVEALRRELDEVVVVAKRETELPPGLEVWVEPDEPRHPAAGIAFALARAEGRPVLACAADMPLVPAELLRALLADGSAAPAVVPRCGGRLQPLLAIYRPSAAALLCAEGPLTATVEAMAPAILEWPDERAFFNVNSPEDLRSAP